MNFPAFFYCWFSGPHPNHSGLSFSRQNKRRQNSLFTLQSLVTFSSKMESKRLVRFDPTTMSYKRIEVAGSKHNINARGEAGNKREKPTSKVASAFPEVDRFIKDLVHKNNGYIRKISFQDCWFLIYELANYRFCHNIKRPHKSNNVKFVVGKSIFELTIKAPLIKFLFLFAFRFAI